MVVKVNIALDPRKTLLENAVYYHEEAKKYRAKAEGAEKAIQVTLAVIKEKQVEKITPVKHRTQWFEKFHYFYTSSNTLVVGGRNAKQNDLLFSKHADSPEEYLLHAEIRGAPAVIVKNSDATDADLQEAAQFAASYSSAWKREFGSIDVYAVKVKQVSKHFQGGYIDQGAFAISGERQWFKNTVLGLYLCLNEENLGFYVKPLVVSHPLLCVKILPGKVEKQVASKTIKSMFAKKLFESGKRVNKLNEDDIAKLLPGNCEVLTEV